MIAVTPGERRGGIGGHRDGECELGTYILGINLDGEQRRTYFDFENQGVHKIDYDYLAKGTHVEKRHWVETN